jgi:hypothetical protein
LAKVDLKKASVAYFDHPDQVPNPGFYILEGEAEEDENGVRHESAMTPGDQVYPDSSGEGFVTTAEEAEIAEEGSEE